VFANVVFISLGAGPGRVCTVFRNTCFSVSSLTRNMAVSYERSLVSLGFSVDSCICVLFIFLQYSHHFFRFDPSTVRPVTEQNTNRDRQTDRRAKLCPWSTKAVIRSTAISGEIDNNTVYGSKLYIFIVCQKSLDIKIKFHEDICTIYQNVIID